MSATEKITEILKLAGVASADFEAARRNYEELDEVEIDRRLARLRDGSKWMDQWRATRGAPATVTPTILTSEAHVLLINAIEESRVRAQRTDNYLESVARATGSPHRTWTREVDRLLDAVISRIQRAVKQGEPIDALIASRLVQALQDSNELISSVAIRDLEQMLRHPLITGEKPFLTATGTIEALARIENAVAKSKPDLIVVINEGRSIGTLIKFHLSLAAPLVAVEGSLISGLKWGRVENLPLSLTNVWVIGHLARTGETLLEVMKQAYQLYRPKRVHGAVLAASIAAGDRLSKFSFHQLAEATKIELAFDPVREITFSDDSFILGGNSSKGSKVLPIPRIMLDRSREEMAQIYPPQIIHSAD